MATEFKVEVSVKDGAKRKRTYSFQDDLDGDATLDDLFNFNQRATFSIAREVLKEEQSDGFDKKPRVRTDNKFGKPDITVLPFGKIEYFARADLGPALVDIMKELELRSPKVSGQYRSGNFLFVNGVKVAAGPKETEAWTKTVLAKKGLSPTDKIRIVNVNPYARKLEYLGITRGKTGRNMQRGRKSTTRKRKTGSITFLKPQGAYSLTYRLVRRRYKALASFMKFQFMPNGTDGIYIQAGDGFRNTFVKDGRPYLYPSIQIRIASEGVL